MARYMITVGEWISGLREKDLARLKELEEHGFSTIEASTHGQYEGALLPWHLPGDVEREMNDMGLNTDGLRILRGSFYPNQEGPIQKRRRTEG